MGFFKPQVCLKKVKSYVESQHGGGSPTPETRVLVPPETPRCLVRVAPLDAARSCCCSLIPSVKRPDCGQDTENSAWERPGRAQSSSGSRAPRGLVGDPRVSAR